MKTVIADKVVGGFFSKGMWLGALIMGANWLNNNIAVVQSWVPDTYDELVLYAVGIAIWGVRMITKEDLADKTPAAKAAKKAEAEKTTMEKHTDLLREDGTDVI